ncbi:MAG TPA: hypothetical protein PKA58_15360 [Polyangium sp.]|nr:hypothetical protein [Polyangium sp.]
MNIATHVPNSVLCQTQLIPFRMAIAMCVKVQATIAQSCSFHASHRIMTCTVDFEDKRRRRVALRFIA